MYNHVCLYCILISRVRLLVNIIQQGKCPLLVAVRWSSHLKLMIKWVGTTPTLEPPVALPSHPLLSRRLAIGHRSYRDSCPQGKHSLCVPRNTVFSCIPTVEAKTQCRCMSTGRRPLFCVPLSQQSGFHFINIVPSACTQSLPIHVAAILSTLCVYMCACTQDCLGSRASRPM